MSLPGHDDPSLRLRVTEQLLDMAAAIGAETRPADVLDTLFERFSPLVPFDRMEYASVSDDGWVFTTEWVRAKYRPVLLDVGYRHRRVSPPPDPDQRTSAPTVEISDVVAYAARRPVGHPAHLLFAEGIRSSLGLPLSYKGRVTGWLFFCARTEDAYDDFHEWVMRRIVDVVAAAVTTSRLSEELEHRNRELEELTSFRTTYLATISHELRNPLAAAAGLAETLRDGLDDFGSTEVGELIGLIADQSNDAAAIVEDLLVLARSEVGKLEVSVEPVDVGPIARTVASAILPSADVLGDATALADERRLRQVLRNLLSNAARYGGSSVVLEIEARDRSVAVHVMDDGAGIPEAVRRHMFEPFVHQQGSGGAGIGLWVSRQLAEQMGGSLSYTHQAGGSRFTLELQAQPPG